MLCTRHIMMNARPFEGMDVTVSLPFVTYITICINVKPASAHSATTRAVQSSAGTVAEGCLVILRNCPKWIKRDCGGLHISIFPS